MQGPIGGPWSSVIVGHDRLAVLPLVFFKTGDTYVRLRSRLVGTTDEEYLWEPVPGMWSVRETDGRWMVEDDPEAPARPSHVHRTAYVAYRFVLSIAIHLAPGTVAARCAGPGVVSRCRVALTAPDQGWKAFDERIHALGESGVRGSLGPHWGPYADNSWPIS